MDLHVESETLTHQLVEEVNSQCDMRKHACNVGKAWWLFWVCRRVFPHHYATTPELSSNKYSFVREFESCQCHQVLIFRLFSLARRCPQETMLQLHNEKS